HRGAGKRFWFDGAPETIGAQIKFLESAKKLSEEHLQKLVEGLSMPDDLAPKPKIALPAPDPRRAEFRILDFIQGTLRRSGRDYRTQCPACAQNGKDPCRDNLAILRSDPRVY